MWSSFIDKSPQKSQESMLKTLQIIRRKYAYKGYTHFKVLPGTDESLIREAGRLADRLSINMEGKFYPSSNNISLDEKRVWEPKEV